MRFQKTRSGGEGLDRHDTYAVGVTDHGVQIFDYRGAARISTPGQVVVLYADETHDGRAGTAEGFGYRIIYIEFRAMFGDPPRAADLTGRRPLH